MRTESFSSFCASSLECWRSVVLSAAGLVHTLEPEGPPRNGSEALPFFARGRPWPLLLLLALPPPLLLPEASEGDTRGGEAEVGVGVVAAVEVETEVDVEGEVGAGLAAESAHVDGTWFAAEEEGEPAMETAGEQAEAAEDVGGGGGREAAESEAAAGGSFLVRDTHTSPTCSCRTFSSYFFCVRSGQHEDQPQWNTKNGWSREASTETCRGGNRLVQGYMRASTLLYGFENILDSR